MTRNRLTLAAVLGISAVLLYLSLRGIEWTLVAHTIMSIQPGYAAVSVALSLVPMIMRAARWRMLLRAKAAISFRITFWALAAGYFGNNFLPARGGELVRSYIVHERSSLGGSYVLATALSERVADAVALVVIGAGVLFFIPEAGPWINTARGGFAAIGVLGVTGIVGLPLIEKPASGLLERWPRWQAAMQQMLLGVRSLHDWGRLTYFTALTAAIWSMDAVATTILGRALSLAIPLSVAMLLIVALSLSSALPCAPGYVGVYQFVAVMALSPFGISASNAIAFILVSQALSYLVTTTLGLLAITHFTPFNWRAVRQRLDPIQIQS